MSKINKIRGLIVIASFFTICITAKATEPFKRHYIVMIDQTITKKYSYNMNAICECLCSWLKGETQTKGLNIEGSVIPEPIGFDSKNDAISLFAFGLHGLGDSKNGDYKRIKKESKKEKVSKEFIFNDIVKSLIHERCRYYRGHSFSKNNDYQTISFEDFLNTDMQKLFNIGGKEDPLHENISDDGGITMSHFVYPLIMNFISKEETANEYYLVIVSDFKSGQFSNNDEEDWKRLKELTGGTRYTKFRPFFEKQINSMRSPFIQADYLHFQSGEIAAKGTRLVMKSLIQKSQVFLSSSLSLSQSHGSIFKVNSAKIAFDKDSLTTIDSIQIVLSEDGNILCRKTIERGNDAITRLLTSNREYEIPSQKIDLGKESLNDISIEYQLYTMSHDAFGNPVLPVVLSATQQINKDDISLINKELRKIMTTFFIILLTSILLFIALWRGKKKKADISVSAFIDEYVDVTPERGAVRQSCLFHVHGRKPSPIPVKGCIKEAHNFFAIPWRTQAFAIIDNSEMKMKGITYGVNGSIISEDQCEIVIPLNLKNGHFKFNIDIYIDPKLDISKVRDMKIDIWIAAKSGLFNFPTKDAKYFKLPLKILQTENTSKQISKNTPQPYEFRFFLIEDIGNTWVGIDPGTTGSCMAICGDSQGRADSPRIQLVKVKYGQSMTSIIPSKLVLSKKEIIYKSIDQMKPGEDYDYGVNAEQTWTMHISQGHNCYQSIKKLLGYKKTDDDKIIARFSEGSTRNFSGVELAHLLVKGLKKSLDDYLAALTPQERQVILPDGKEARRAVVAIPNNYTLSKTLDMVNSIKMLGTFQEVRFIYEAEGVLFNYLRMTYGKKKRGTENIMVFDMGGATINVSIFEVNYFVEDHTIRFKVRTLSRIGYAVGGDNIDVALLETIFTMSELKGMPMHNNTKLRHDYEAKNKTSFLNEIFGLKKEIVALQKAAPAERLSNYGSFENFVRSFENSLPENIFEGLQEGFTKRILDRLTIKSKPMQDFIYKNIEDAVSEVIRSKEVISIDRIIFSGRSTMFPGVKDKVKKILASKYTKVNEKIWEGLSDDEIKTCVANGACWYGRYGLVQLDNSLINGSYGFKHTDENGPKLHVVLDSQLRFDGDRPLTNSEEIESAFAGDANNICFYQIMGNGDTENIFDEKNRHKLNFLGAIHVKNKTNKISISVDRQNKVKGVVLYESDHEELLNVEAEDHDLVKENEWPYIFHTLTEDKIIKPQSTVTATTTDLRGGRRRR